MLKNNKDNSISTRLENLDKSSVYSEFQVVFFGSIFNYQDIVIKENLEHFKCTPSELLVQLYKKYDVDFVHLLNGAFSFCVYDKIKDRYFCARDRYGKKPLYYYADTFKFISSHKIKPIIETLGFTPKLNKVALSQYLQYFVPLSPNTFYTNIYKLEAGSYLVYENHQVYTKKYYKIKTYKSITDEKTALEIIEKNLYESVEKRVSSTQDIGTLLSGGIDSSLVSTIYSQITNKKINTFSVGYKTHKKYSELPFAKIVADKINSNHIALEITQKDFIDSLDEVFENLEEPHADPAAIPLFLLTKEINKQGIKTVLSGEGSDELFLGYDNYAKFLKYYEFEKSLDEKQIKFLNEIISSLDGNKEAEYLRRVVKKENLYNSFGEIYTSSQRKKLLLKVATFKSETPKKDPVDWMSYIDMKIWLGEALLSKVEKMASANSVETRNPFLDFEFVNTAFSINSSLKVGDTNKYLLKKIAQKYIPQEIIQRQKKGFNSPFNEWLFLEYKEKLLLDIQKVNKATNLFDDTYIEYIYNNAKNNKLKQHFYALWHFCKWYDKNYL